MPKELDMLCQEVITIAELASEKILAIYNTKFDVTKKDDNSPLTEADMEAHHTITDGLQKLTPDIPILSEESADIPFATRRQWRRYWLVDPLDGTREFVKRNGEFTVNIALIDGHRPVIGVIHTPVTGVCYYAADDLGAFKKLTGQPAVRIATRRKQPDHTLVAGSRSHRGDSLNTFLEKIGSFEIINMGSSLKSCLVAEGKVDIYPRLGPTSEWDTAAAQCIVENAGGKIVDLLMQPMRYNTKESILNPQFLVIGDLSFDWSQYF
ncbi:MAG TPA: 3'(2'),5'-bisphosphate nucleotidase CysQ [Gammaproteobacteria bacterium]